MNKYHVFQTQNGKTITYGDFNVDNPKEAINMACKVAKKKYPQYNRKVPFQIKEYGKEVKRYE